MSLSQAISLQGHKFLVIIWKAVVETWEQCRARVLLPTLVVEQFVFVTSQWLPWLQGQQVRYIPSSAQVAKNSHLVTAI